MRSYFSWNNRQESYGIKQSYPTIYSSRARLPRVIQGTAEYIYEVYNTQHILYVFTLSGIRRGTVEGGEVHGIVSQEEPRRG